MVTGLAIQNKVSAKKDDLVSQTVLNRKTSGTAVIINYPAQFNGMASSVLIDNQDGANAETVRINRNSAGTITIPASGFRAFNDSFIEQIDLSGPSTNTQITAQVVSLKELGLR